MFPETRETERLVLRQLSPASVDVYALYDCFNSRRAGVDAVFEYIDMEGFETPKDAQDMLETASEEWEEGESAKYAVYEADDTLAGLTAMITKWERKKATLAVILGKPHWGNGYAGECAATLTDLAFGRLDLELVEMGYDEGNDRSKAAIESFVNSMAGQYDGVWRNATPRDDGVADNYRYSITRQQYEQAVSDE